jgi:hypothetical protein
MLNRIKSTVALGLALAALAPITPAAAKPLPEWYGRYVWEEPLGRVGGSSPTDSIAIFVTYTLALGPGNGSTSCLLRGEGYQTNRQMQCTATPQGNSVIIKFYKFGPDNMGGGGYALGAPLFTMTRAGGGIVTQLQALSPSSDATPRRGRLFRPTG